MSPPESQQTRNLDLAIELSGFVSTLGPILFLLVLVLHDPTVYLKLTWPTAGAIVVAVLVSAGGLLLRVQRSVAGVLVTLGLLGFLFLIMEPLSESPSLALLFLVSALFFLVLLRPKIEKSIESKNASHQFSAKMYAVRLSCYATIGAWFVVNGIGMGELIPIHLALLIAFLVTLGFLFSWAKKERRDHAKTVRWVWLSLVPLLCCPFFVSRGWLVGISQSTIFPLIIWLLIVRVRRRETTTPGLVGSLFLHPERTIVLFFVLLALGGGLSIFLLQGFSTTRGITLIDSLFTAVSSVCVTGLTVVDTERAFSFFGQFLVMLLIQLGGLGIMTVSSVAVLLMGRRISLRHEYALTGLVGRKYRGEIAIELREVIRVTSIIEAAGAALLTLAFLTEGDSVGMALWRGIFTSISAFCNAGFAIQSANLVPYQNNGFILNVVAWLIILGGLSPAVIVALRAFVRRQRVALETRIVLVTTVALLLVGTLVILVLEWSNTLAHLSFFNKIWNAWFQSVTPRTAGFNSVDLSVIQPTTALFMMALMFIGGSPGGTAGGIKTTVFTVLLMVVVGAFQGRPAATIFGRQMTRSTVQKSLSITLTSAFVAFMAIMCVELTQHIDVLPAMFEVFSALGTVGLSMGATTQLDTVGKVIIMLVMMIGRVGPLTVFLFMAGSTRQRTWELPEEDLVLG